MLKSKLCFNRNSPIFLNIRQCLTHACLDFCNFWGQDLRKVFKFLFLTPSFLDGEPAARGEAVRSLLVLPGNAVQEVLFDKLFELARFGCKSEDVRKT